MGEWGPSHQTRKATSPNTWRRRMLGVIVFLALLGLGNGAAKGGNTWQVAVGLCILFGIACVALPASLQRRILGLFRLRRRAARPPKQTVGSDPLGAVRRSAADHGGGVYVGQTQSGWRYARPERAVLLVGPSRSGKTSGVIIPTVIAHPGPVVAASTKPDLARATQAARARSGRVWVFDPTGTSDPGIGQPLRWSPVQPAGSWDDALLVARAMTAGVGSGTTDRTHWAARAQALLAPMLHAAAVHGRDMGTVVDWVMRHDLEPAGILLEDDRCSQLAFSTLLGVHNTEDRERSSIFSAAADALQAYSSEAALDAAKDPNFDPAQFVTSTDTVYIHAGADEQAAAAPIVCGLLAQIRRETYRAHAGGQLAGRRMLFALDEVANIAPLEELPQIASEGAGQGLTVLAALQDLSQARKRWGHEADGFLTLFGTKLIFPGVADQRTLESVSTMLGEYDRQIIAQTRTSPSVFGALAGGASAVPQRGTTVSTQRTRVLSPGEVANIPAGGALHLDGVQWELVAVTPAHATEPWRTLTSPAPR